MNRISESDIVLPALYYMYEKGNGTTTSQLIEYLSKAMHPSSEDLAILDGRNDSKFSQIVRNLKSHNTLIKGGWATYSDSEYKITKHGAQLVEDNLESIKYLLNDGFEYSDICSSFKSIIEEPKKKVLPFNEIVSEGYTIQKNVKSFTRSKKLRDAAFDYYSHDGILQCDCCGFNSAEFYSPKYTCDCIEIHHIKPIFTYDGDNLDTTIGEALKNLIPVCPNCHRVIHKRNIGELKIADFKSFCSSQRNRI